MDFCARCRAGGAGSGVGDSAPLTQGQHDALVSLCFNLRGGAQRLPSIAPQLVAKINSGDYTGAAEEFLDIDRANGKVLPGLVRRREAEKSLFMG